MNAFLVPGVSRNELKIVPGCILTLQCIVLFKNLSVSKLRNPTKALLKI